MSYPDSKQRIVLGWQIRWIAGLFSLLIVAAGAIPAYASDGLDSPFDAEHGVLFAASHAERNTGHDLGVATTSEFLGSTSAWEPDLEDHQTHVSAAFDASSHCIVRPSHATARPDDQSARPAFESGRLSPRAPPLV